MMFADAWVVVGAVAGIIAALGAIGAVIATVIYGRRTDVDARLAIRYERLREARELLTVIRTNGGNTNFAACNDACARLRALLPQLGGDFPATGELVVVTQWDLGAYMALEFPRRVDDSIREVDDAIASLGR